MSRSWQSCVGGVRSKRKDEREGGQDVRSMSLLVWTWSAFSPPADHGCPACSARSDTLNAVYEDHNLSELKGCVKVFAQCAISVAASVLAGYQEVSFTEQARDESSDVADAWTVHCMRAWGTKRTSDHMSCTKYQLRRKSFSVMWAECRRHVVVNRVECRMKLNVFDFGSVPKKARVHVALGWEGEGRVHGKC